MDPNSAIRRATMWPDMSTGMHDAKFRLTSSTGFSFRYTINDAASKRTFLAIFYVFLSSSEQFELLPFTGVLQVFGFVLKEASFAQNRQAFFFNFPPRVGEELERVWIRKVFRWPPRIGGQAWNVVQRSLIFRKKYFVFCTFFVDLKYYLTL